MIGRIARSVARTGKLILIGYICYRVGYACAGREHRHAQQSPLERHVEESYALARTTGYQVFADDRLGESIRALRD